MPSAQHHTEAGGTPSRAHGWGLEPVRVAGKFLFAGSDKFYVRGVTYGTFEGSDCLPAADVVESDFRAIAASGANVVRVYTVPPQWLLDTAAAHGLRVLVGIPWEQHVAFLDSPGLARSIETFVRAAVRACRGHRAVLAYVIGNEIPPDIVRWHGRQRTERFIERLYRAAKQEDPSSLVTYANYPSTEYLHLPFLDFVAFNVFLEERARLSDYLARVQVIAGDRPLMITELGLDSRSAGERLQAESVAMQITEAFAAGSVGCCVFSWTDDWVRGGVTVDDWTFGMVDHQRRPKPALAAMSDAFRTAPFDQRSEWPRVSVVVCSYNGAATIGNCVDAVLGQDYPDFEAIVIDDGSSDTTGQIALSRGARVIQTPNRGLSAARNTGVEAADGEIVAFCDDDCVPDPDWLRYLVGTFRSGDYAGVGGPNVPPRSTLVGDSVGHAPGGPNHVLLTPTVAEHLPGCNMAVRRNVLRAIGGFDPQFRVAGDDVDVCWRIQDAGGTLGFSPGALVWHQPRTSVRAYARQQAGYGRAEALLERKWPERYNGSGHLDWGDVIYGGRPRRSFLRSRWHVYHGPTGRAPFQSVYSRTVQATAFPLAPEWYLLLFNCVIAQLFALAGQPILPTLPFGPPVSAVLLALCVGAIVTRAGVWTASVVLRPDMTRSRRLGETGLIFGLCLVQPLVRMWGRTHLGLTPWRRRGPSSASPPRRRTVEVWTESWQAAGTWLDRLTTNVTRGGALVQHGSGFDTWDLQIRVGPLASARVRVVAEEHGGGRQMLRIRIWPRVSLRPLASAGILAALSLYSFEIGSYISGSLVALAAIWFGCRVAGQAAASVMLGVRGGYALALEGT